MWAEGLTKYANLRFAIAPNRLMKSHVGAVAKTKLKQQTDEFLTERVQKEKDDVQSLLCGPNEPSR